MIDLQTALFLVQDGVVNGAIYGLMALALVLLFSVTRIIFIPQGELVAFGALSMAALAAGRVPGTLWLLLALAAMALAAEGWRHWRGGQANWPATLLWVVVFPVAACALAWWARGSQGPASQASQVLQVLATLAIVVPVGPLLYRVVYRPLADATVLTLLIVSVALHGVLVGLGLLFFGAEGSRTQTFSDARFDAGGIPITGQAMVVVGTVIVLVAVLIYFFGHTIVGKALRATAMNRVGARLNGIPTDLSGDLSFALSALVGTVSGLLVAPFTTVYYDTGFLIGLKGFVAAILGGLVSYPLALIGALMVGQLEAFSSFWASSFKEVLVFALIIPVLLFRSLQGGHVEDTE